MGGCATKPNVLKEEGEAPKPVEDLTAADAVDDTAKAVAAGEESKEGTVDDRKSLGNFLEDEEKSAAINEEKAEEEKEDAEPEEQQDEEKKAAEASEAEADTTAAAAEEKKQ